MYDAAGHLSARDTAAGTQSLTWDDAGRLTQVTTAAADGSGEATTSGYVYASDGSLLVDHEGGTSHLYLPGEDLTLTDTGVMSGVRRHTLPGGGTAYRTGSANAYGYEVSDQHGTGTLQLDYTGATATWRQFTPFGGTRDSVSSWTGDRAFLNAPSSTVTGLTRLGARSYDPVTGRFISLDPVLDQGDPLSLNGYTYADLNPVGNADPTGLRLDPGWGGPGQPATSLLGQGAVSGNAADMRSPASTSSHSSSGGTSGASPSISSGTGSVYSWVTTNVPVSSGNAGSSGGGGSTRSTPEKHTFGGVMWGVIHTVGAHASDITHTGLAGAGFIPVLGAVPDGLDAGLYLIQGDKKNAALSAIAAVPGAGDLAAGVRAGVKGAEIVKAASQSEKAAKAAENVAQKAPGGVSIYRTPKVADAAHETAHGPSPANHQEGDRSVYFGEQSVANDYVGQGGYADGSVRYDMHPSFLERFADTAHRYDWQGPGGSARIEFQVPVHRLPEFNQLVMNRTWVPGK